MDEMTPEEWVSHAVEQDCPHDPEYHPWTYHRSCHKCWSATIRAAVQAEREACAMIADTCENHQEKEAIAAAIRARGQENPRP